MYQFTKLVPVPEIYYMPVWTIEELSAIACLYPEAADVWEHRFEWLGGIPRVVFQNIRAPPKDLLLADCHVSSFKDCLTLISLLTLSMPLNVQRLIHMMSTFPYRQHTVDYASKMTLQVVAGFNWRRR